MRSSKTTRRSIAQRARRDAEAELREPGPEYPAHGVRVGRIIFELHGREIVADLLSTGHHCRSYGVRIAETVLDDVMGADAAWREISRRMPRMMSLRRCF